MQKGPYTRYANKKLWLEALDQGRPEPALIQFFRKYHNGLDELSMAIDNVQPKYFPELLSCCLETLNILSHSNNSLNINFMNQVLASKQFNRLFQKELEAIERKYIKRQRVDNGQIENDRKFIHYFLNFGLSFIKIQSQYQIQNQLCFIECTLQKLQNVGINFAAEQQMLQQIKQSQFHQSQINQQHQLNLDDDFEDLAYSNEIQKQSYTNSDTQETYAQETFSQDLESGFEEPIHSQLIQKNIKNQIFTQASSSIQTQNQKQNQLSSFTRSGQKQSFSTNKQTLQYFSKNKQNQNPKFTRQQTQIQDRKIYYKSDSSSSSDNQDEYIQQPEIKQPIKIWGITRNTPSVKISYRACPIEPLFSEFSTDFGKDSIFNGQIIEIPINIPFESTNLYLNNNFFILREDYIRNFRIAVSKLKIQKLNNTTAEVIQNAFLYHHVLIENILVTNKGLQFVITMNIFDFKNRKVNWKRTKRLMPGSLLLLSSINLELMLFGTVYEKPNKDDNGRVNVVVQLIGLTTLKQLQYVNMLLSSENQIIVIENQVYYETYTHFLKCIQNTDPTRMPFQDQIVYASSNMPLPGYLDTSEIKREGIVYEIDLKFDLHQQKQIGRMSRVNILREWSNLNQESLDKSQLKAIQIMLRNGISLIQGPPGTGKTFCGALGVRILLQNQYKWNPDYKRINKPILIVCQTNHALDQFLEHILTFCDKKDVVRIGGRCKVEHFQDILLQNSQKERRIRFEWNDFIQLRDVLDKKLKNLLNLVDNVNYLDMATYVPQIQQIIINQYLEAEDLHFINDLTNESKKMIVHMWLDTFKPRQAQADRIIQIEFENGNLQKKQMRQRRDFKPVLQYKISDLANPINISEEVDQQLQNDKDDEVDENDNLDSDDDENRKCWNLDDGEKNAFVQSLINNKNSLKRLLNRLGQENINSFKAILDQDFKNPNLKIWEMSQSKRNVISRFVFGQKFQTQFDNLRKKLEEYEEYLQDLKQAYIDRDLQYIQTKKIVGVTLAGCAKYADKLQNLKFNILIVEEAGEVLESKLVSVLTRNVNHLILIGDHQQLKPHLECYDLEVKFRANISLFERLIRNGLEFVTLTQQRRMKTKFADFIRLIYSNYEDHQSIQEQNKIQIQGVGNDLLFFNHTYQESVEQLGSSKSNHFEAEMIIKFTDYLLLNQTKPNQITILCTYVKQALRLQKKVQNGIKVQTVDNYQGEENDIIILSLVRSNKQLKLGFVGIDNRVCVAFSRARIGFYIFGDFEFIELSMIQELSKSQSKRNPDTSDLWLKIISLAKQKNVMFNYLTLNCSSHNEITKIYEVQDWNKVKGGGCQKTCLKEFPCGHICKKKCHQSTHKQEDCQEQCEKMLSCGHQCRGECRQKCPACIVQVEKIIPKCQHKLLVNCSEKHKETQCFERCEKILPCGHQCTLKCFDQCNKILCSEKIEITLNRCKHKMKINCSDQKYQELLICQQNCQENLLCDHTCQGKCGSCFEKFHQPCKQKCDKILYCGHQCQQQCKLECYECKQKCQIECNCGDKCSLQCNKECRQCVSPCKLSCQHSKCNKKCFELCDRNPCNQRCQNILQCGCQCMGFCGEKCPNICLDSSHNTNLADEDTIYYELECSCNLIMKARDLDNYFNKIDTSKHIKCPDCYSILWKSSRYQEKIKQFKTFYSQQKSNKRLQYEITQDRLEDLKELVLQKLKFIKENNIKDEMSFLDNILQEIKSNLQLMKDFKDSKLTYQEYICIKAQLDLYQQTLKLKQTNSSDQLFKVHRQNLINEYLLNEDYRKSFSNYHQWKVEQKLKSLLLYSDFENQFKQTNNRHFQQFCFQILDLHFFIDDSKYKEIKQFCSSN